MINQRSKTDHTALGLAMVYDEPKIVEILRDAGGVE